jgi:hypothetical protein
MTISNITKIEPISVVNKSRNNGQEKEEKHTESKPKPVVVEPFQKDLDVACEKLIHKAKTDDGFDFRSQYVKGQRLWYINYNEFTNSITIEDMTVSTVYEDVLIGRIEDGEARYIDAKERDMLYNTPLEAEDAYNAMKTAMEV